MENTNNKAAEGFHDFVVASVTIKSSPDQLYNFLTDIENLSQFFPQIEFKLVTEGPLKVGSIYHTRQKGAKNWSAYRVLILEINARMSAELTGKDLLFEALRYDHRFIVDGDYTISHERVDYKFRYGIVGQILNLIIGKRLVKKQVLDAHLKLKEKAEKL
jgi:ribosome-associated toxin RatA of RatAB toxin-antitoxin module